MSIRFAAARRPNGCSVIDGLLKAGVAREAANDNRYAFSEGSDRLLNAALRHFAAHGLSAAEQARINAEEAFFAGNEQEYRWWLSICSTLDRRMAAAIEFRTQVGTV